MHDTDAAAQAQPDGGPVGTGDPVRPARLRSALEVPLATGLAALIVIGLAVGLVLTTVALHHDDAVDHARSTALAAAQTYAVELATYDYRHLDQDFGAVLAHADPSFKKSFTASSNALRSVLAKYDATAKATVVAAGVTTATTTRAVVLVFLTQTVTNTAQKDGPTVDDSRVSLVLVRSGGHWLIDQVRLL